MYNKYSKNNYSQQSKQMMENTSNMSNLDDYNVGDSTTYGEEEQDQLRFQLDVKPILLDFERRVLRGQFESIVNGEKKWVNFDLGAKPIINEIGIREVMGRLFGYCNIATKLSYYEVSEIYKN